VVARSLGLRPSVHSLQPGLALLGSQVILDWLMSLLIINVDDHCVDWLKGHYCDFYERAPAGSRLGARPIRSSPWDHNTTVSPKLTVGLLKRIWCSI